MSLIRFKNSALPLLVENHFNKEASEFFDPTQFLPAVNILEKDAGFQIEMAAPGLKKENFKINLVQNTLTISFSKENNVEEVEGKFTRREFRQNSFRRSFSLPQTIESELITASYEDGILHLFLPKKEEAKQRAERQIEIK